MKKILFIILSLIFFIGLLAEVKKEWPVLKGPYLGQKPPRMKAELFAPGIVSTEANEDMYGFYNNNSLFFFECFAPNFEKAGGIIKLPQSSRV